MDSNVEVLKGENMAFSELVKNFTSIRNFMRQFFVYGFRSREEFDVKSGRSYDNEKRRVESWLKDYMSFRRDANGKSVFMSVDSRQIHNNPLYRAWKTSSFTRNDISLHFLLLDILSAGSVLDISEILECIDTDYMLYFQNPLQIDDSTLRKKMKEYVELGLIVASKLGKKVVYRISEDNIDIAMWKEAFCFFSEGSSLGLVGSFLMDKFDEIPEYFSFKHRYLLFALDSEIMLDLLLAIQGNNNVELELFGGKGSKAKVRRREVLPLKLFISVQSGRQYLAAYSSWGREICFVRLETIQKVKQLEVVDNYAGYQEKLLKEQAYIWGVSLGDGRIEHIEMVLKVNLYEMYVVQRLEREKRCGTVEQLDEGTWKFSADVFDAMELLPWLRTFIGRIVSLTCSNVKVEEQFWEDLSILARQYGIQ